MIDETLNLLPTDLGEVAFHGTARCSESEPYCVSVGTEVDTGDLILANQVGGMLKIPAAEVIGVFALIAKSLEQRYGT